MLAAVSGADDRTEAKRLRYEIEELIATGRALSSERDTRKLLGLILKKCRQVTGADAGSVYVLEGEGAPAEKKLHFMLSQNDSLQIDFQEFTLGSTRSRSSARRCWRRSPSTWRIWTRSISRAGTPGE